MGPVRTVTEVAQNVVYTLDDLPALDCLLNDLGSTLGQAEPLDVRQMLPRLRSTLAGLSDEGDSTLSWPGQFGTDTRVRHLIGLEPSRRGLALADTAHTGMQLAFCQRNVEAARRDLVRICAELREEAGVPTTRTRSTRLPERESAGHEVAALDRQRMVGAVYVSCAGSGRALLRRRFGRDADPPATPWARCPWSASLPAGEIAHRHLYGYTGVLTLFLDRSGAWMPDPGFVRVRT